MIGKLLTENFLQTTKVPVRQNYAPKDHILLFIIVIITQKNSPMLSNLNQLSFDGIST